MKINNYERKYILPVLGGELIIENRFVSIDTNGYIHSTTTNDISYIGISAQSVDNTNGSSGDLSVSIYINSSIEIDYNGTILATDYNKPVYLYSSTEVSLSGSLFIGYVTCLGRKRVFVETNNFSVINNILSINTIYSNTTLNHSYSTILANTINNDIDITIPTASSAYGKLYNIKKIHGNNSMNILISGSDTIDGQSSIQYNNIYDHISIQSDGTNWFIV